MNTPLPKWKKKLPMWLTWGRIAICPAFVILLYHETPLGRWVSAILFILASITDWFDGALARKYQAESNLGKFMDPIADKILVATVLVMLLPSGRVGPVMVILLLVRDILIGGIRSVAAADGVVIAAKAAGKWKTGLQMVGIPALLLEGSIPGMPLQFLGLCLLWTSVILSAASGVQYTRLYMQNRSS